MEEESLYTNSLDVQDLLGTMNLLLTSQQPTASGSVDPTEVLDEFLTSPSLSEPFLFQDDVSPRTRTEECQDAIESITDESIYECFPFQMDKNENISSSRSMAEVGMAKDSCGLPPCQLNADNTVSLWKNIESYIFLNPMARLDSRDGPPAAQDEDTSPGAERNLCDLNSFRLQLFGAIYKGNLEMIDSLLKKMEASDWNLSHPALRDPNTGQTCLMKALLKITNKVEEQYQDSVMVQVVRKLISFSRSRGDLSQFVNAAYTDKIYRGQTALHIAVERRRCDLVRLLMQSGATVDPMAKGSFFRNKRHEQCSFYFGGFPLGLAACTNQPEVVSFLMEQGADPRAQDRAGNTVLHALVSIAGETAETRSFVTTMYDLLLTRSADLEPPGNLEKITNRKGLTPLRLAACIGKIEIFKHILGREIKQQKYKHLSRKFTEWEYGPVSCSLYYLSGVDTIEENSVLQTVVYSSRNRIILQDILRFLLIYAVFIVGFAAALASLIEECPVGTDCPFDGFSAAILELFKLTIGLGDLGMQKHSRFPIFFHTLLVLYVILTFILLLNMLIALMGETVTKISSESEKIWKLQRAVTTLYFERTMPRWLRTRCKNNHSFTEVTVGLTPEGREDRRWCLRLNETKWSEWDTRIETLTETG
ncbi:transient receptor potential cation channel subfamily V member 4-like [Amblyraja radiata]|uniref:transient receptor potential cation channel subfamily V member 4-like n=1 Tax=Amblyraja radiata TaxID=386614 RepID=UPI001404136A|nr:transient receptor potential cation channel subfamily V member 4-like [Amblyraja radiata]